MSAKYLVDSDVCILALGGKRNESQRNLLQSIEPEGVALSVISYGEVFEGVLFSDQPALNMQRWRQFLRPFDVIDVTPSIAEIWSQLRGTLRKQRNIVPDNDLIIASTALRFGMTVVTGNVRHFGRVEGLEVLPARQ